MFWFEDVLVVVFFCLIGMCLIELVIVGGGYIGLWIVICVKECDFELWVVVFEVKMIGWVVFGCNGGFVEVSLIYGEENGW